MATKIEAKGSMDHELVKECMDMANCGDCDPTITWITPENARKQLPDNTVAVIVDMRDTNKKGAIRIFGSDEEHLDAIGTTNQRGKVVIVLWDSAWYMSAAGALRVGCVKRAVR